MGRYRKKRRQQQIATKQKRKTKLAKLRQAFLTAKTKEKKDQVLEKVFKIAPWLSEEKFMGPAKQKPRK